MNASQECTNLNFMLLSLNVQFFSCQTLFSSLQILRFKIEFVEIEKHKQTENFEKQSVRNKNLSSFI